jgi:hypothetical protein
MKKFFQHKLNNLILIVFLMLLAIDFSGRIYVKVPSEQRSVSFAALSERSSSLPYPSQAITALAQQWVNTGNTESDQSALVNNLEQYDSLELAGFKIALLAIYGDADRKALLWLKATDSKDEQLTRVSVEQQLNGLVVESISKTSVTLKHNDTTQQLQLFKPAGKSQSGNTTLNEQN